MSAVVPKTTGVPPAGRPVSAWVDGPAWRRYAPRVRDVLAIVLSLAMGVVWFYSLVQGPTRTGPDGGRLFELPLDTASVGVPEVVALVLVVASCAALWWRRSHPVALTIATVAVALVLGFDGAMFFALLSLAVRRRDRLLTVLAVAAFVASWTATMRTSLDGWVVAGLQAALGTALCVFVGAFVGARRDLVSSWRERAERAEQEYSLRAEQARLAERTRIAREMHDVLAHRISLVALHAGGLEVRPDVGPEQVEATAATIRETARTALEDLRRVLGVLRAPGTGADATGAAELTPQPTLVDLRRLVESSREAGVAAEFRTDVPLHSDVPPVLGRTVYRVVQEALTNVHKHAAAAQTVVTVSGEIGRELVVAVVNARAAGGSSTLPGAGSGLVGLSERVGLADGTITSGPEPGGGFAVRVRLPWPAPDGGPRRSSTAAWTPPDARITPSPAGTGRQTGAGPEDDHDHDGEQRAAADRSTAP